MRRNNAKFILRLAIVLIALGISGFKGLEHYNPEWFQKLKANDTTTSWTTATQGTSSPVASVEANSSLLFYGEPTVNRTAGPYFVLPAIGFVVGYDAGIQNPVWVSTRFFRVNDPKSEARPDQFTPDPRIPTRYRTESSLWTRTGYDRGHMAPNWGVSICYGREAQIESFVLTNITPQTPELNRGIWASLEKIISNDYANRFGQVWVICGPVFSKDAQTLKDGKVLIPAAFYKIVVRQNENGSIFVLPFIIPQNVSESRNQRELIQYLTNIDQIEKYTDIDFFPELPDDIEQQIEMFQPTKLW